MNHTNFIGAAIKGHFPGRGGPSEVGVVHKRSGWFRRVRSRVARTQHTTVVTYDQIPNILPSIANYQNPDDIPLIFNVLSLGHKHENWKYGMKAIEHFPNKKFHEYLESFYKNIFSFVSKINGETLPREDEEEEEEEKKGKGDESGSEEEKGGGENEVRFFRCFVCV